MIYDAGVFIRMLMIENRFLLSKLAGFQASDIFSEKCPVRPESHNDIKRSVGNPRFYWIFAGIFSMGLEFVLNSRLNDLGLSSFRPSMMMIFKKIVILG